MTACSRAAPKYRFPVRHRDGLAVGLFLEIRFARESKQKQAVGKRPKFTTPECAAVACFNLLGGGADWARVRRQAGAG